MNNELKRRQIPDFFGNSLSSVESWEKYKSTLLSLILDEEYGKAEGLPTPTIKIEEQGINFAGKAKWESIYFTFENEKGSHTVKTDLILPISDKAVPVFLEIGFNREIPNKYFPTEEIIDNGFGVFYFCYEDATSDDGDFNNGLCALLPNGGIEYGKIALWSYMASICMDYLETRDEVDSKSVAIIGHSRLGKTALLTSALDSRFVLTCVNNSGCCGASLSRGKIDKNENITHITDVFPFWFKKSFMQYRDNENILPFDQHMLLSLVAPRNVIIGGAYEDFWADNEGQFLSAYLASPVWALYGKNGLVGANSLPKMGDMLLDGSVGFYLRSGKHFLSRYDWNVYMKKFKEILK